MEDIKLIKPTVKDKQLFEDYKNDFNKNGEKEIYGDLGLDKDITYEEWLERVDSFEKGEKNVPKTLYALLRENDNKIIGTFTICHYLDEGLYLYGGHIAGSTCPSERGKGYAKISLNFALEKAKELGIQYILCTCDEENKGSSKTIKSCGGQLENVVVDEKGHKIERYWINLGKEKLKANNLNNSLVTIIAPATNLKESNIEDINDSIKKANDLGIKVEIAKNAYSVSKDKEEKIKEKIEDIHSSFDDKKINGMFCAKGGQFCKNLIDKIDYNKISKHPKVFGGISDGTFLLNAIYAKIGLITFHMSDFKRFVKNNEYNEQSFKHIFLENQIGAIPQREPWITLKNGIGTGTLVGGNLTCLTMLSETDYFPTDDNLILFFEDLEGATTPEGIKENINILKNKGILNRTKGLLIADYINSNNLNFEDILLPELKDYDFPIIKCHDFGHAGINCVLPVGCEATINGFNSQLVLNEKPLL